MSRTRASKRFPDLRITPPRCRPEQPEKLQQPKQLTCSMGTFLRQPLQRGPPEQLGQLAKSQLLVWRGQPGKHLGCPRQCDLLVQPRCLPWLRPEQPEKLQQPKQLTCSMGTFLRQPLQRGPPEQLGQLAKSQLLVRRGQPGTHLGCPRQSDLLVQPRCLPWLRRPARQAVQRLVSPGPPLRRE